VDAHDRRSVRVFLTERGHALRPQVERVADQLARLIEESVTQQQMETFQHVLSVLQNVKLPEPS